MKKFLAIMLVIATVLTCVFAFTACDKKGADDEIIVFTNAFFAPFEYYDGKDIVGVDIDIMNKVGEKLGKKVKYENKDFAVLIDNVADGKLCDCAAAGFTITDERKEKVNFSVEYFKSVQYVIFAKSAGIAKNDATDGTKCYMWNQLGGKKIGVQLDTTGNIYVNGEIDGWDGNNDGAISNTGAECKTFDDAQLAFSALKAGQIDCVVVDKLPAQYIIKNDTAEYEAYPLYYDADTATEEQYGIAVNKNNTELLNAINEVLQELLNDVQDGKNGIERLVMKHFNVN